MILLGAWPLRANGQGKSAKKTKTTTKKAKGEEETPESSLKEIDFGAAPIKLGKGDTTELDATPEGRERLATLERRVKEVFTERDKIELELRPLVIPRDRLAGEVALLNQALTNAQQTIVQGRNELRNLQRQLTNGGNAELINTQISNIEFQLLNANNVANTNQEEIAARAPELTALNMQIQPLEQRLLKLWVDLNESRKQWLEIRQPQFKYAHGNFEGLKEAIDEWILVDSLWPEAFCWAALTNYELGNYESAWNNVDRAAELRRTLGFNKAWAQGEALRGMIAARLPERKNKSAGHLQAAQLYALKDKNAGWEVFFLVGRAVVENDKQAIKARTSFERALKLNADAACVKYWYGQLQTTASVPSVRDIEAGTQTLEELWKHSTKQSWRLAQGLVLAYEAANRKEDAEKTWKLVTTLAPQSKLDELQEARSAIAGKTKPAGANDAGTKSKSTQSTKQSDD